MGIYDCKLKKYKLENLFIHEKKLSLLLKETKAFLLRIEILGLTNFFGRTCHIDHLIFIDIDV